MVPGVVLVSLAVLLDRTVLRVNWVLPEYFNRFRRLTSPIHTPMLSRKTHRNQG